MTEPLPGLPGRLPDPPFAPSDDRYAGARAAAGRRRRTQLTRVGGGATAVAAVVVGAALLGGPGGPQVLDDAGRPDVLPGESAPPRAPEPEAPPSAGTSGTARPTGSPVALPPPLGDLRPTPSPSPSAPATRPPSRPPSRGELNGPEPTLTDYVVGQECDGSGYTAATGWCSAHSGARSARRGTTVELATSMCRLPGQPEGRLRAASGQYADFVLTDDAAARWTWSKGKRFSDDAREFTVPAGRCLRFAVRWDVVGDDGRALAAGDYVLTSSPLVTAPGVSVREQKPMEFVIT